MTSNTFAFDAGYLQPFGPDCIAFLTEAGNDMPLVVDWDDGTIWCDTYVISKLLQAKDADRGLEAKIEALIPCLIQQGRIDPTTQRREEPDLFDIGERVVWTYNLPAINAIGAALDTVATWRFARWADRHVYVRTKKTRQPPTVLPPPSAAEVLARIRDRAGGRP